jgi:hypothetical protein
MQVQSSGHSEEDLKNLATELKNEFHLEFSYRDASAAAHNSSSTVYVLDIDDAVILRESSRSSTGLLL